LQRQRPSFSVMRPRRSQHCWIDKHGNTRSFWHNVAQEPQPLSVHLAHKTIDTGRIAAGSGEARYESKLNRVLADAEDDRDCRGCSFGGERGCVIPSCCGNHSHFSADEIGHQCRQSIVFAFQPVKFDLYVLAIDVAGFAEALIESGGIALVGIA
jgi:hypothetical protein